MFYYQFFLFLGIKILACSPKVRSNLTNTSFQPLTSKEKVILLSESETVPENSNFVGDIRIGDTGFSTDCGYQTVIDNAREVAQRSGANIIKLTKVRKPNFISTCYRIQGRLYRNTDPKELANLTANRAKQNESRLPEDADYAVVYFYRPNMFQGSLISYKIRHNDDTVIGKARNGYKFEFKTNEFGQHIFWSKTESRDSVVIDVKRGQEYFVRCGINTGVAVGRPEIYIMENAVGIEEYEKCKYATE